MIDKTVEFDELTSQGRISVRYGLDDQLDRLRRQYNGLESFLAEVVKRVIAGLPDCETRFVQSCVFLPQLGFLIAVELDTDTGRGKIEGAGSSTDEWELILRTEDAVCYKDAHMRHLDEQFGDIYCEIGDREVEILHHLAALVLGHEQAMKAASEACGEFDVMIALAMAAERYKWVMPTMTAEAVLDIEGGRHPLQELTVPTFIPNGCHIPPHPVPGRFVRETTTSLLVLSGPNHSGKSIYLKQVALIVFLAHIGSFVPAHKAVIGMTNRILTRISARESVCQNDSAFALDLRQVHQVIRMSTCKTLLIVDEFGKGTRTDDGAGLLAAFIEHFSRLGAQAPRALIATHLHEIFNDQHLKVEKLCYPAHMAVATVVENVLSENHVAYLFRLEEGFDTSSFGSVCASVNGVPSPIVHRAQAIALLLSRHEDISMSVAKLSEKEERRLELAENVARKFLSEDTHTFMGSSNTFRSSARQMLNRLLESSRFGQ